MGVLLGGIGDSISSKSLGKRVSLQISFPPKSSRCVRDAGLGVCSNYGVGAVRKVVSWC